MDVRKIALATIVVCMVAWPRVAPAAEGGILMGPAASVFSDQGWYFQAQMAGVFGDNHDFAVYECRPATEPGIVKCSRTNAVGRAPVAFEGPYTPGGNTLAGCVQVAGECKASLVAGFGSIKVRTNDGKFFLDCEFGVAGITEDSGLKARAERGYCRFASTPPPVTGPFETIAEAAS